MIRNPEILIFDEATNALDSISEAAVQRAIDEIARDHTVIIVAHRLSTIVNADKIIVLGGGRILEEGKHEEDGDDGEPYDGDGVGEIPEPLADGSCRRGLSLTEGSRHGSDDSTKELVSHTRLGIRGNAAVFIHRRWARVVGRQGVGPASVAVVQ